MKNILIDGSFVSKQVTGVQRFNWCVLEELVKYTDINWYIAVSKDTDITKLKSINNITIIQKGKKNNKYWQFITLGRIARKLKAQVLAMSNFSPLFKKDYVVLHDVTAFEKEGNNNKLWALKNRIFIRFRFKSHKNVFTVSEFSKGRISTILKYDKDRIHVCYSGGDHWNKIDAKRPENFIDKPYVLSVGSATANKNFKYVVKLAEKTKDINFMICGRVDEETKEYLSKFPNVSFTGYIDNSELKYYYLHATSFILPSTYEGFGLPPLEAVYCGVKSICLSNIDVFKELYQGAANYFDPYDYENQVDLHNIKEISDIERKRLIETFNWFNVARKIHDVLIKE